jgi:hypothetical protein
MNARIVRRDVSFEGNANYVNVIQIHSNNGHWEDLMILSEIVGNSIEEKMNTIPWETENDKTDYEKACNYQYGN